MFNLTSFNGSQGAPSGIMGTALAGIRSLLTQLLHSPETGVVKLTVFNPSAESLIKAPKAPTPTHINYGYIVGIVDSSPYTCARANGLTETPVFALAVSLQKNQLDPGDSGYFRMTGVANVAMVTRNGKIVNPANGDRIYASNDFPGRGTVSKPEDKYVRSVGWIVDVSNYEVDGTVQAILEFDDILTLGE